MNQSRTIIGHFLLLYFRFGVVRVPKSKWSAEMTAIQILQPFFSIWTFSAETFYFGWHSVHERLKGINKLSTVTYLKHLPIL